MTSFRDHSFPHVHKWPSLLPFSRAVELLVWRHFVKKMRQTRKNETRKNERHMSVRLALIACLGARSNFIENCAHSHSSLD